MSRLNFFECSRSFFPEKQTCPELFDPGWRLNQGGFITSPMALAVFIGLMLTVSVYKALEYLCLIEKMGYWGSFLPFLVIVAFSAAMYAAVRRFQKQRYEIGKNDRLFARRLMADCLDRTCLLLDKRLKARPAISLENIFYEMIEDKIFDIYEKDCLRFPDIRRAVEQSGLQQASEPGLRAFFQSSEEYARQPLDNEIQLIGDVVYRRRPDLKENLEKLKKAHKSLFTALGNYLTLLPPDLKKVENIRKTYRYRAPGKHQAMRMVFALDAVEYLKAFRFENVKPFGRERYESVSRKAIPQLAKALNDYQDAWKNLVSAYEAPSGQRE